MPDPDDDAQVTSWAPFGSYTTDDDLPPLPDEPPPLAEAALAPLPETAPTRLPDLVPPAHADDTPLPAETPPEVPSWEDFLPHRPAAEEDEPWRPRAEPVEEDEPSRPTEPVEDPPWRPAEPVAEASTPESAEPKAFFNWTTPPQAARAPQAEPPADTGYVPGRDDAPAPARSAKKGASGGVALFLSILAWLFVGPLAAVAAIVVGANALRNPRTPGDRTTAGLAIVIAAANLLGLLAGLSLFGGV